ncbi:MAG: DUF86 domain-containing protein [Chitinophagales bacterium]|nr:DUF86 domain-containing protein [Chitinophagales bacterium]
MLSEYAKSEYDTNYIVQLALVKLIENIGEASTRLSVEIKNEFSEVEWKMMKAMRNKTSHEYFAVDYQVIWDTIQTDIPLLKKQIENILAEKFS